MQKVGRFQVGMVKNKNYFLGKVLNEVKLFHFVWASGFSVVTQNETSAGCPAKREAVASTDVMGRMQVFLGGVLCPVSHRRSE